MPAPLLFLRLVIFSHNWNSKNLLRLIKVQLDLENRFKIVPLWFNPMRQGCQRESGDGYLMGHPNKSHKTPALESKKYGNGIIFVFLDDVVLICPNEVKKWNGPTNQIVSRLMSNTAIMPISAFLGTPKRLENNEGDFQSLIGSEDLPQLKFK